MFLLPNKIISIVAFSCSIIFSFFINSKIVAQESIVDGIVIGSPTALGLGKYGEIPVSLYTGIPNVDLPLFQTKVEGHDFVISASYNSQGILVTEVPGPIGEGWSLNAGGVITRTIRGQYDETTTTGFFDYGEYFQEYTSLGDFSGSEINSIHDGTVDSQPDEFRYNFMGYAGRIIYDSYADSECGFSTIPISTIEFCYQKNSGEISKWEVRTPDGVTYLFEDIEISQTIDKTGSTTINAGNSSWFLSKITYPAGTEVTFQYANPTWEINNEEIKYKERIELSHFPESGLGEELTGYLKTSQLEYKTFAKYISKILIKDLEINFYTTSRSDYNGKLYNYFEVERNNDIVKKVDFIHSYWSNGTEAIDKRLRLDGIHIKDDSDNAIQKYILEYNSGTLPSRDTFATDHWGYYNGKDAENTDVLPELVTQYPFSNTAVAVISGANKEPDPSKIQNGMLKKVIYPTGGYTELEYESNGYGYIVDDSIAVFTETPQTLYSAAQTNGSGTDDLQSTNFTVPYQQMVKISVDFKPAVGCSLCSSFLNTDRFHEDLYAFNNGPSSNVNDVIKNNFPLYESDMKVRLYYVSGGNDVVLYQETMRVVDDEIGTPEEAQPESHEDYVPLLPGITYILEVEAYGLWDQVSVGLARYNTVASYEEKKGGGLRIKKIKSHDGVNTSDDIVKTYYYTKSDDTNRSSGAVLSEPNYHIWLYDSEADGGDGGYFLIRYSTSSGISGPSSYVVYKNVEERIGYSEDKGYTRYEFEGIQDLSISPPPYYAPYDIIDTYSWDVGQLISSSQYDDGGNLLVKIINSYYQGYTPFHTRGVSVNPLISFTISEIYQDFALSPVVHSDWQFYDITTSSKKLASTKTEVYNGSGSHVDNLVEYEYSGTTHDNITKKTETNSNGDKKITEYKYAHEKYNGIDGMDDNHMLTQLYSVLVKNLGGTHLSKYWTVWSNTINGGSSKWLPKEQWVWESTGSAPADPSTSNSLKTLQINHYDGNGNPFEAEDALGTKTSFVFDEDGVLPIGIFKNTFKENVLTHSFAYDGLDGLASPVNSNNGFITSFSVENGKLKIHQPTGTVTNYSTDYQKFSLDTEFNSRTVIEMDLTMGPNISQPLLVIGAGGSSYNGGNGGSENLVWTRFYNDRWQYYDGGWNTIVTNFNEGEIYNLKIVADPVNTKVDYYVDGVLKKSNVNGRQVTSGIQNISVGMYGRTSTVMDWYVDNLRVYPESAQATTAEIDATFGVPVAIKDVSGNTSRFEYDDFGRLYKTYNPFGDLTSTNSYYYSLQGNSSYTTSDPNRIESWSHFGGSDIVKSVSYIDGLGREIQSQLRGTSNTIVTGSEYNNQGQIEVVSRPVQKSGQTTYMSDLFGSFTPGGALSSSSQIHTYYSSLSGNDEDYAYIQNSYEESPLSRVLKSTLPGPSHKMGTGKEIENSFGLNSSETFQINGYTWSSNKLIRSTLEDPDGKKSISYMDAWGQTIVSGVDMSNNGSISYGSSDLVTAFEYDELGNLVRVVDPRSNSTTYTYNKLGQLKEKKLPDQSFPNKYRYDDKGRLRYHRDPNLDAGSDYYYYTKYDDFDRPLEIGIHNSSSNFDNTTYINDQTFPTSNASWYIKYSYDGNNAYSSTASNLTGKLTRIEYKDLSTGYSGFTWYSYNKMGLVEWIVQRMPNQGSPYDKKISYSYDEGGRVEKMHFDPSGTTDDHYFWFYYDEFGRLETLKSYRNDVEASAHVEAEYSYYADGQVAALNLGGKAQSIDYSYTVQGWLAGINNPDAFSESTLGYADDRFGETLRYYSGFTGGVTPTALYNGNIAQIEWEQSGIGGSDEPFYSFTYDIANRLTNANFHDPDGTMDISNGLDVNYSFDKNGNITAIDRNSPYIGLTYNYMSPNSISITGSSNRIAANGISYQNGPTSPVTKSLGYDSNGNVTTNTIQGITATSYDWRNLPYSMTANGTTITYAYDADGNRIKKKVGSGAEIWYVRDVDGQVLAIYSGTNLVYLNIPGGIGTIEK